MNDEQMQQSHFTLWLALLTVIAVFFIYSVYTNQYTQEKLPEDCSGNYDYPICKLAVAPSVAPPAHPFHIYLSILASALFALILVILSYEASVIRQEEIVTSVPSKPTTPSMPAPKTSASMKPGSSSTPQTIINNQIPPETIVKPAPQQPVAPPAVLPKEGVDPKVVKNG